MSCYEWEEGTIYIPANQWSKFRKSIIQAYNAQQERKKDHLLISRDCSIYESAITVKLENETKTLYWHVSENNHAREHAAGHWLGRAVFTTLSKIRWPSRGNTGGVMVGNDEYNRENNYVGGGGNYITAAYGPAGKKAEKLADPGDIDRTRRWPWQ